MNIAELEKDMQEQLITFVGTAATLGDQVAHDARNELKITEKTLILLSDFRKQLRELEGILDLINGEH